MDQKEYKKTTTILIGLAIVGMIALTVWGLSFAMWLIGA